MKKKERGDKKEKKERKVNQRDERGAMQFQAQAGAPKKNNFRGAKFTAKREKSMNNVKLISILASKYEMSCSCSLRSHNWVHFAHRL